MTTSTRACAGRPVRIAHPDGTPDHPQIEALLGECLAKRGQEAASALALSIRQYVAIGSASARLGCGAPLDDVVDAVPEDGLDHVVVCPRCQNEITICRVPPDDDGECDPQCRDFLAP